MLLWRFFVIFGDFSLFWRFIVILTTYRHFDDLSSFWLFNIILTIYRYFDVLSSFWRFIVILTIYRHYDDLSLFWRFIVILTIYSHFDDLSLFWRFIVILTIYSHFDDFELYNYRNIYEMRIYALGSTIITWSNLLYFEVIGEELWWFFCILWLFHSLKALRLQLLHDESSTYEESDKRTYFVYHVIGNPLANRPHTNVIAKKNELYIGIHDSRN